ncbi:MAG: exodeoxyribonuclease VII small subunit [Deltaproteobacteria bacterium]|nr:exodeoxyribonuclease VII small subunit [Deltaproteobacteria bacterium]
MAEKKFEEAMEKLQGIVDSLEGGDLSLEKSLKIFEEGMELVHFCSRKLEEAEQKVSLLVKEGEGKYVHQGFEPQDKDEDG